MKEGKNIQIIEWKDLDKKKFYTSGLMLSGLLRFTIYPANLIKTRLQAQEGKTAYKGLFDAFKQIGKKEGIRGFYKGFPISLLQVVAGQLYITTYEASKEKLFSNQHISVQHLLGGFAASTVSQTIMVPVDVISQHQQVLGAQQKMTTVDIKSKDSKAVRRPKTNFIGQSIRISQQIVNTEGLRGLYRGYLVSLLTYGTNSALYWLFYYLYSELIEDALPQSKHSMREPMRIVTAGLLGSTTGIILTNPLDVIRTRYQLQIHGKGERATAWSTYKSLVEKEGYKGLCRGLSARIIQSSFNSCVIILAYEYIKKISRKKNVTDFATIASTDGLSYGFPGDLQELKREKS
ncbi:solute carrier family 25 member 44-like [Ciona intestinalis]